MKIRPYYIPWALCWATIVHSLMATGLLLDPENVVNVAVLVGLDVFISIGIPTAVFAVVLYSASLLAAGGLYYESRSVSKRQFILLAMFPQYFLVTAGLINDLAILAVGNFRGNDFPFWAGVAGLGPVMVMALLHNCSAIERYFIKWHRTEVLRKLELK